MAPSLHENSCACRHGRAWRPGSGVIAGTEFGPSEAIAEAMTDTATDILPLAADFPPATREQWLALVERLLEGAPFDSKLVARTSDGLTIQPLYEGSAQGQAPVGRLPGVGWQIIQRIDHPDPTAANAEARHDRHNGATGLSLVFAGSIGAYGYGVAASEAALVHALDGIAFDAPGMALELDTGP